MKIGRHFGLALVAAVLSSCNLNLPDDSPGAVESPQASPTAEEVALRQPATPAQATETAAPQEIQAPARPIESLAPGSPLDLTHIHMLDALKGWGIGGIAGGQANVLVTSDGGTGWKDVTPPEPAPEPGESAKFAFGYFADADRAWILYAYDEFHVLPDPAVVWRTRDGGEMWESGGPLDYGELAEFFIPSDLHFVNDLTGWVLIHVGAGMQHDFVSLMRTENGGDNWDRIVDPAAIYIQSCPKTGMVFADEAFGWTARDCSGVVDGAFLERTFDGGSTWDSVQLPAPIEDANLFEPPSACVLSSPNLFPTRAGALVVSCRTFLGEEVVSRDYFYATGDGGETWTSAPYPGGRLYMLNAREGWALARQIYQTRDGGQSWIRVKTVAWDGQFSFVTPELGWAVARNEDALALVKTENGGRTWAQLKPAVLDN